MRSLTSIRFFMLAIVLYGAQAIAAPFLACCNPDAKTPAGMIAGEHGDHVMTPDSMSMSGMHHHHEAEARPEPQMHDPGCDNHCGLCLIATGVVLAHVLPATTVYQELPQTENVNPVLPSFPENPYRPPILA